jgi:hypothetical protein
MQGCERVPEKESRLTMQAKIVKWGSTGLGVLLGLGMAYLLLFHPDLPTLGAALLMGFGILYGKLNSIEKALGLNER